MKSNGHLKEAGIGAAAGLLGTGVIQAALAATKRWMPETLPPMKQDPGEFMVEKAKSALPEKARAKVPKKLESGAAFSLAFGYGLTFGALYAAVARKEQKLLLDGTCLGLATWAAGYLGWLPASGLMPPVWKQKPKQVFPNLATHALFGIVTAAALGALRKRL
jgi:hypothetical protein